MLLCGVAPMGEPIPKFFLINDDSLDTVFQCRNCRKQERFNYHVAQQRLERWGRPQFADFSAFRSEARTSLEETHVCSTD